MSKLKLSAIWLSIAMAVSACQTAVNTNKAAAPNSNSSAANVNTSSPAPANTAASVPSNTEVSSGGSPTEVFKVAHYARQKKDIATLKKIFAKDIIDFFTEIGKADKKSLDDMLIDMCKDADPGEPEARNEKINGDKATIEYKEKDGKWKTMDFVKEDGSWKMTVPKGDPDKKKDDKDNK